MADVGGGIKQPQIFGAGVSLGMCAGILIGSLVTLWLGAVVADFVWMWPIFTGGLLTNAQWHMRMWFPSWI